MNKTLFIIVFLTIICLSASHSITAQPPTGDEILKKIDMNMSSNTQILTSKMVIHGRRGSRTVVSKSWSEGESKTFSEYLSPAREKGTKMLKLEDKLWIYSPSTDRTIRISGHMLRQSVMGSDLSYEDMMEDSRLRNKYRAVVEKSEVIDERECWIVELTATADDVAYHRMKLWVDKKRWVPLKEELFAKSGKLLKKLELKDVTEMDRRWFPKRMIFKDMLKKGDGTEFIIEEIEFDKEIPGYVFSKASLRK
ncbi:MAG: outer membrane lipoprotein-sorting protein [Desulfobacteraceae bacterium]|jgi:outer membrane lipoprotein-sorting protein